MPSNFEQWGRNIRKDKMKRVDVLSECKTKGYYFEGDKGSLDILNTSQKGLPLSISLAESLHVTFGLDDRVVEAKYEAFMPSM